MGMPMNLDDLPTIRRLDTHGMIDQINQLPEQLEQAWELGQSLPLPATRSWKRVVITGMGGSAIGADLAAVYMRPVCPLPIFVERQYDLPAWARGPETLVIVCSHSGETEETLSAFEQAHIRDCQVVILTAGGQLADLAREYKYPLWLFDHSGYPGTAIGFSFGLLVAGFYRMGMIGDPYQELREALHALRNQQTNLLPEVPVAFNPAKRMAGQLVGRWAVVFAADYLEPVARRWKDQISELAKSWAQCEALPEADHNILAGLNHPENSLSQMIALFLAAPSNHPRNRIRIDLTSHMFITQGINTDLLAAKGEGRMAHLWTLLHLGEYTAYYLAIANGEDPGSTDALTMFKHEMESRKRLSTQ